MRIATIVGLSIYALVSIPRCSLAQAGPTDSSAAQATVRRFHEALIRGDSIAALTLLAPDAIILEAGGIESRAEYRAHHLPIDIQFAAALHAKTRTVQVTLAGDVAWITSEYETTGTFDGRPVNRVAAELAVLTRTDEGWRIRAIHWSSRRRTAQ